ncbi:hypothetical protein ACFC1T_09370 [Kitasatospora sp. NPDC056076]|uniref:hypothetical protein n=1 Tax=Kitasatospora sp. NPDC056076 TaxID=3345703 RepID=UPI0035DEB071
MPEQDDAYTHQLAGELAEHAHDHGELTDEPAMAAIHLVGLLGAHGIDHSIEVMHTPAGHVTRLSLRDGAVRELCMALASADTTAGSLKRAAAAVQKLVTDFNRAQPEPSCETDENAPSLGPCTGGADTPSGCCRDRAATEAPQHDLLPLLDR